MGREYRGDELALKKTSGVDALLGAERKRLDICMSLIRLGDPEDERQILVHDL
jgi:hypothetical protein